MSAIMSNMELHNSYKCYDSIPTPPDGLKHCSDDGGFEQQQSTDTLASNSKINLARSASLDSLVNSSEQDSSLDELSDSDSLCELKNITPCNKNEDKPRQSDIEEIKSAEAPKEPVINAYLANSHKTCDYENCGYKKESFEDEKINIFHDDEPGSLNPSSAPKIVKTNRRNSVANSDYIRRMETILEEPFEPKISVKEILARFETMRETAEVKSEQPRKSLKIKIIFLFFSPNVKASKSRYHTKFALFQTQSKHAPVSSGAKAAAATLNASAEKMESNGATETHNGNHSEMKNGHANGKRMDEIVPESMSYQQNGFAQQRSSLVHQQQSHSVERQEESSPTQTSIVKYSLLQFAMQHFHTE